MHDDVISHCIVGFVVTVFSLSCISLTTVVLDSYTTWNQIKISLQTMKKTSGLVFLKTLARSLTIENKVELIQTHVNLQYEGLLLVLSLLLQRRLEVQVGSLVVFQRAIAIAKKEPVILCFPKWK